MKLFLYRWPLTPPQRRILLLLLTLLAFGLRLYHLDDQSMWSDEGLSLYRARQPFTDIFANVIVVDGWPSQDTNPPFYFLLLHLLRSLIGESVFSLRFLGVLAGTASVPLMYQLGRLLFGYSTGIVAALLLAISPFHIWQSQEMRNYPILLLLNLVSVYALSRLIFSPRQQKMLGLLWGGASLLAIYTHYFGFFVFAFGILFLILANWRHVWYWLLLLGILALPLMWLAFGRFTSGPQFHFRPVWVTDLMAHAASVYSVGMIPGVLQPWWRVLPVVALVALGSIWGWRYRRASTMLAIGYLFIPLTILVLLSFINPLYNGPRHLLIGLPAFLLLAANGLRWPRIGSLLLVAVVTSQLLSLSSQFQLTKDDIRGVATYLSEVVRPGDGVVLHDTIVGFTFDYYYDSPVDWVAFPRFGRMDREAEQQALAQFSQNVRRLWFVTEPTPRTYFSTEALVKWVNDHYPHLFGRTYPSLWLGVKLDLYVPNPIVTQMPAEAEQVDLTWVNGLQLRGIEAETAVKSGHEWWTDMYWAGPAEGDYLVSWRFVDGQGEIWAEVNRPLWPAWPPSVWPMGALIYQPHRVDLPGGLPPGHYQVWLRLLEKESHQPVALRTGEVEALVVPNLVVQTATGNRAAQLPPHTPLSVDWGEIMLGGYHLEDVIYRPGHVMNVNMYWQAQGSIEQDYEWVVQLVDPTGQLSAETITTPTRADYPPTQWQPGEWLQGQATVVIPPLANEGEYAVQVGLRDPQTGRYLRSRWFGPPFVTLGRVRVVPWPLQTTFPPIPMPLAVTIGDPVFADLAGYALTTTAISPTTPLSMTLFWQAQREIDASYAVFVHLIDEQGRIVAQRDSLPVRGSRPTTSWRTGEVLLDQHDLSVGTEVAMGEYQLWVGLYDPDSGERPVTVENGITLPEGRIFLGHITVK